MYSGQFCEHSGIDILLYSLYVMDRVILSLLIFPFHFTFSGHRELNSEHIYVSYPTRH